MTDPKLEDHVVGLELQLVELVEREHRAEVQGLPDQVAELQPEIQSLQAELASSAEQLSSEFDDDAGDAGAPPNRPVLDAAPAGERYRTA